MKRALVIIAAALALAGCTHKRLNPVTVNVAVPQPVYLEPAQGRIVSAVLVDLPPDPSPAPAPQPAATATPIAPRR